MASNQCYIPILNPLKFTKKNPVIIPAYGNQDMDDFSFADRLQIWQEKVYYKQKWQTSDMMYFQFESNFATLELDLYNFQYTDPVISVAMSQVGANPQMPGWYIYQAAVPLNAIQDGCYYMEFSPGTNPDDVEISEPLEIKTITDEPSILYQYKHSHFHGDVIFETGIQFSFRVEGARGKLYPVSDDTFYRDQKLNPFQLKSTPHQSFDLSMGGSMGMPDWMVEKINWIWSCDSVLINGKSFAKDTGTNNSTQGIQINEEENYPLYGLTMLICPGINRASRIVAPTMDTTKKLLVGFNIDGTLYGDLSANVGDNLIPIISSE